jgi:short-subunit dehydrogenase
MNRTLAVITGASSGIGATFARELAPRHDLLLIARRKDKLDALAAELAGTKCEVMVADLGVEGDLERVAERLRGEGRLELLVNNAGFGSRGIFWESPLETQEQMHRLHVMATVRLCHAALANLVPRNTGAVINVASVAAFVRRAGGASYGATKSWMAIFSEGLHLELRQAGSRTQVQALCPGFTYSEFHDTMGVERSSMAPPAFWLSAEHVVADSLAGLTQRKFLVVPGWRYRLLAAALTKLPVRLRLLIEARATRGQAKADL